MQLKHTVVWILALSLLFATAIVVLDRLTEGTPWNQTVTYLMVAVWFVPISVLASRAQQAERTQRS
ncbi:hypothetical protein KOR34_34290 [Posidoniimonas corsicana]|uniref:Uncharacterized protein n=1 Tax=Posidoniimonas corsicana TaxID=1938618 RepID=A0A5C5V717_9BACT|nr:hypothetical protein [Posidoniimonas corsicana]TWT33597.1 hypothetical protein KOR34_34290 [Posidoniimonas corsicana]